VWIFIFSNSAVVNRPYPRGFVDGCTFLKDGDRAKILGLNAARLLKLKLRRTT
jgi:hypothetical protein